MSQRRTVLGPEIPPAEFHALERAVSITHDVVSKVFKAFAFNDPVLNRLCYRNTRDHKSYGYFIGSSLHQLCEYIARLGARSVLDLGCGACVALEIVRRHLPAITERQVSFGGIEIEMPLIKLANEMFPGTYSIKQTDLLKIERQHIASYDILYMWEPISNEDAARLFIERLVNMLHPDQTIVLHPNGRITAMLSAHPQVAQLTVANRELVMVHLSNKHSYV